MHLQFMPDCNTNLPATTSTQSPNWFSIELKIMLFLQRKHNSHCLTSGLHNLQLMQMMAIMELLKTR